MTVSEAIRARRSVRKYKEGAEVSDEQIRQLFEAAMLAPSAANGRPWEFVVVKGREAMEELAKAHGIARMLSTASCCIVVCGLPDASERAKHFFPQDCAAATENILLQAVELGLATCWCGVWPVDERVENVKRVLGVDSTPFNLIAVGVADEAPDAKGFFDPEKVKYF